MFNLENAIDREKLSNQIKSDIDDYCVKTYQAGHRNHLGASILGDDCSRKSWYTFRWIKKEEFSGRMLRLFQVGHSAEPRFVKYLEGVGFKIYTVDPNTNKQFRMIGCNGHYGGSLDAMCEAPERYQISEPLIFLNEFKTNKTGVDFTNVDKDGVTKAKPKHYKQMCQYGKFYKLKYGIYLIENKNDSEIIVDIVRLDWNLATEMEHKAYDIINSKLPPPRISDNPAYTDCSFCSFRGTCHFEQAIEKNCRSCKMASPVDNGEWFCSRYNNNIPKDFIPNGCPDWLSVVS